MREASQRSTMGTIFWEIYRFEKFWLWPHVRPPVQTDVTYVRTYRLLGWRWENKTASGDGSVRAISLAGNRVAELHLETRVLVWAHMYEMKVPWAFFAESKTLLWIC